MFFLLEGVRISAKSILISGKETVTQFVCGLSADAKMPSHKAVVGHVDVAIGVINGRTIKRIAHYLPPMLPARIDVVVVIIVLSAQVVGNGVGVVVVDRAALVLGVKVFKHHIGNPSSVFKVQFRPKHPVFKVVNKKAAFLFLQPFVARTISVVV